MRLPTKRRLQRFAWFLLAGILTGLAYGSLLGFMFRETGFVGGSIGTIDGALITAAIAATEMFLLRTRWGRVVQQAPFLVTFGVKWLVYGMLLISAMNLRSPGVDAGEPVVSHDPASEFPCVPIPGDLLAPVRSPRATFCGPASPKLSSSLRR